MLEKNEQIRALAQHLELTTDEDIADLEISSYDEKTVTYGEQEYLVVTDEEADELWEESLDSYIDECILHELPEQFRFYFDSEKWKRDAKFDGRGHSLNHYDGSEHEEKVNDTYYYIYRQN